VHARPMIARCRSCYLRTSTSIDSYRFSLPAHASRMSRSQNSTPRATRCAISCSPTTGSPR
jgi:hypothetical protein